MLRMSLLHRPLVQFMYCIHFAPYWLSMKLMFPSLLLSSCYSFHAFLSDLNRVKCLVHFANKPSEMTHRAERVRESLLRIPSASLSPKKSHMPVDPCLHTNHAGMCWERRSWGGVRGFEAWGWQLLALFIFDLTWPLRTRRLSDHRRTPLLRLSCAPVKRTAAPARGVVLSCFKGPLSGTKKLGLLVWNDTQRKTIENKAASQAFRWGWGQWECWFT